MGNKTIAAALACALLAVTAFTTPGAACEEEGPGLVSARVEATLAPEDAERIIVERFDGTLVVKGIVLRGWASWHDGEAQILEGPVVVSGMLQGTGDEASFLYNRGLLWLRYTFLDADGVTRIGSGEGFVTLEQITDLGGSSSFQGSIVIEGVERQFAGTGESGACGILPPPVITYAPAPLGGEGGEEGEGGFCADLGGLVQEMEDVVITGAKPGFEFEAARNVKQLNKQYTRAKKQLTRERAERQRVLRRVR